MGNPLAIRGAERVSHIGLRVGADQRQHGSSLRELVQQTVDAGEQGDRVAIPQLSAIIGIRHSGVAPLKITAPLSPLRQLPCASAVLSATELLVID